jgi:hypothetical protein
MHKRVNRFAGALLTAMLLSILFGAHTFAEQTHTQASTLSISQAFVTDGSNNPKSSFSSGNSINYHIIGNNASGNTLSVSINFWADTKDNGQQHIIIDKTFSVNIAPGGFNDFTMSAIPAGTVSGAYTFNGLVYENGNPSNSASLQSSTFSVTYVATYPLQVPYYSQFQGQQSQAEDCGPTSAAMVVSYYADVNPYTNRPGDLISKIRSLTGKPANQGTNATDLKDALWNIDQKQIFADDTKLANTLTFDAAVQQIKTETQNGNPVIAFVDGTYLVPKRSYVGHWIVITGIVDQTVYINDPDNYPAGPGKEIKTTQISLDVYKKAATSDGAKSQNQPYGLVITGEQFQSA